MLARARTKRKRPSPPEEDATIRLSARYLDEFIKLRSAPMLLEAGMFPDAKEISEAMAGFNAFRQFVLPNVPQRQRRGREAPAADADASSASATGRRLVAPASLLCAALTGSP